MRRLIINADDFGLSRGVNLGIVHAFREGIVTSTTLMVNMPGAAEAYALARENPALSVGLHVTLTAGRPLAQGVESLTGPDGRFRKLPGLKESARLDHLRTEVDAQVQACLAAGLRPTHLDSHHHVHREMPAVAQAMAAAAARLGVPVRRFDRGFSAAFYGRDEVTPERLVALLHGLPAGLCEIMCHPGYVDPDLLRLSSYTLERVLELQTLTDPAVRAAITAGGMQLVNYKGEQRVVTHG